MAAVAILVGLILATRPRRLEPGETVSEPGVYRSPGGTCRITISKPSGGFKSITLSRRRRLFWLWYEYSSDRPTLVDQERDWFHGFDQYDRLWSYRGPWDKEWGSTRKTPEGGFAPHAPSVCVEGWTYFEGRGPYLGASVVTSTGGWEGVPAPFLDRLPDKRKPIWGQIPPIPLVPPEFTAAQGVAILSELRKRS